MALVTGSSCPEAGPAACAGATAAKVTTISTEASIAIPRPRVPIDLPPACRALLTVAHERRWRHE
jgi:hypothetical protein